MDVRELGYAILPPPRHPLWGNVVIVEMYFIFKYAFWGKIVRRDKAFSIGESFVRCTAFQKVYTEIATTTNWDVSYNIVCLSLCCLFYF